jgi:hypothetical protein
VIHIGHFDASPRWWTLLALANPSDVSAAQVWLRAYEDDGVLSGNATYDIPINGVLTGRVEALFGVTPAKRGQRCGGEVLP